MDIKIKLIVLCLDYISSVLFHIFDKNTKENGNVFFIRFNERIQNNTWQFVKNSTPFIAPRIKYSFNLLTLKNINSWMTLLSNAYHRMSVVVTDGNLINILNFWVNTTIILVSKFYIALILMKHTRAKNSKQFNYTLK